MAYQYYLCVSPADGHLYISDPEKHQILRALSLKDVDDPSINMEAVVGSGERCIPGDEGHCGDGGNALEAKLAHPKGTVCNHETAGGQKCNVPKGTVPSSSR